MRQIVYISTAAPDLGRDDVSQVLDASARNNPGCGITGFLVYNGQNFLQLIEGPEESLSNLMAELARDPRHSGIVRLEDHAIGQRACSDWVMKSLVLTDDIARREANLAKLLPAGIDQQIRRTILNFAALN